MVSVLLLLSLLLLLVSVFARRSCLYTRMDAKRNEEQDRNPGCECKKENEKKPASDLTLGSKRVPSLRREPLSDAIESPMRSSIRQRLLTQRSKGWR